MLQPSWSNGRLHLPPCFLVLHLLMLLQCELVHLVDPMED